MALIIGFKSRVQFSLLNLSLERKFEEIMAAIRLRTQNSMLYVKLYITRRISNSGIWLISYSSRMSVKNSEKQSKNG